MKKSHFIKISHTKTQNVEILKWKKRGGGGGEMDNQEQAVLQCCYSEIGHKTRFL